MSEFEIAVLVIACIVPLVSYIFVKPKRKKKEKKETSLKNDQEVKVEEKVVEPKVQETKQKEDIDLFDKEIQSYAEYKKKNISKPERIKTPVNFKDVTMPYIPQRKRISKTKPKNIVEEIHSLSPELKAMIFSGVLDKKNFDE